MNKRLVFGILIAVAMIAAVVLITLFGNKGITHNITLPSPAKQSGSTDINDGIDRLEVNADTVQTVLRTLKRAESYSLTYTVTSYWASGKSQSTQSFWLSGNKVRMTLTQGRAVKNILLLGNALYIWYNDPASAYHTTLAEDETAGEIDAFARLVTYEDVLGLPAESVLSASYADQLGKPCIYVEYQNGSLGYISQVYVSIESGLLISAEIYDGDTLIYEMTDNSTILSTPSDEVFKIPS